MNSPSIPSGRMKRRRRVLLYGSIAALALLVTPFLAVLFQPRLRDSGGEFPNPVRVVWEWFFPPPIFMLDLSNSVIVVDDVRPLLIEIPDPGAPEILADPPDPAEPPDDE
jgi:hypothetical protein